VSARYGNSTFRLEARLALRWSTVDPRRINCFIRLLTMLVAAPILADLIASSPPHVAATHTSDPPTIDGKLDDAAWKTAPPVASFTQKFPNEGMAPSDPTTMRILYDDDAIYVAFECEQAHSAVVDRLTRRDREV